MSDESKTCAVVVIHGIGEQRPMSTLRGFVEAILAEEERAPKFFNKPDRLAETYEVRKLQNRRQPRVHFFEYYWAYKAEGTKLVHVYQWGKSLLLRWPTPRRVPAHLRLLFALSWLTILLAAAAVVLGVGQLLAGVGDNLPSSVIPLIAAGVTGAINLFVLSYLGDAARYLSPAPANIRMRQAIRSEGVKLLRALHDQGYGRVIVVGHSLGSVIAYDLLKQSWIDFCARYEHPRRHSQPALAEVERLGRQVEDLSAALDQAARANRPARDQIRRSYYRARQQFQDAQFACWRELRDLGCGWRVTDLITLGSPLAHAAVLMAIDADDLNRRQLERELPTCPPAPDMAGGGKREYAYQWHELKHQDDQGEYQLRWLHHAALFACTRWTNCYFPAWLGVFGDLVGGPLRAVFGPGVRDVPVRTSAVWGLVGRTLLAHNRYWRFPRKPDRAGDNALRKLRQAVKCEDQSFTQP